MVQGEGGGKIIFRIYNLGEKMLGRGCNDIVSGDT
jgi:hypothetical protein